jgi:hypothetical protein
MATDGEDFVSTVSSMTVAPTGSNGGVEEEDKQDLLSNLKALRREATDLYGKSKVLEVPGYHGMMAIEYQYISSEVTEKIARDVRRETKNVNGIGTNLLASLDTLIAASKNVLTRREGVSGDWLLEDGTYGPGVRPISGEHQVNLRSTELSRLLDYDAADSREVVLGLFGSEHSVIEQNIFLSRWLTDKTRTADEDFLG